MLSTARPQDGGWEGATLAFPGQVRGVGHRPETCQRPEGGEVTEWLAAWSDGDPAAFEELVAVLYLELKNMAGRALRRERPSHTLQATALVHEAYLRLLAQNRIQWRNRAQFLGVAGGLMRRILVDHARRRQAEKRDGGLRVTLNERAVAPPERLCDLLLLDRALSRLERRDPRQARIVELRYFAGLKIAETAETLGVSTRTVKREWTMARAWLKREIQEGTR